MRFMIVLLALMSLSATAHQNTLPSDNSRIDLAAAFTWRNQSTVETNQVWQPAGFVMGGEAFPYEKGATLDDFQLLAYKNFSSEYYVKTKVGGHSHSGENSLELENIWFGKAFDLNHHSLVFEVGKMATEITPTANYHASDDDFTQANLLSDFFFGRHFDDTGLAARWFWGKSSAGVELFSGENFPASKGECTRSLYMSHAQIIKNWQFSGRLWSSWSNAELSSDQRYSEHSHVSTQATQVLYFSGDTHTLGGLWAVSYQGDHWQTGGEVEYIKMQRNGLLAQTTQSAYLDGEQSGLRFKWFVQYHAHKLVADFQKVAVSNLFSQTSSSFLTAANLINQGFEPDRSRLGWHYQVNSEILVRTELARERLNADSDKQTVVALGLVWHYNLYSD